MMRFVTSQFCYAILPNIFQMYLDIIYETSPFCLLSPAYPHSFVLRSPQLQDNSKFNFQIKWIRLILCFWFYTGLR